MFTTCFGILPCTRLCWIHYHNIVLWIGLFLWKSNANGEKRRDDWRKGSSCLWWWTTVELVDQENTLFLLFLLFRACPHKTSKLQCKPLTLKRKITNRWSCVWVLICYCCWISYLQCEWVTLGTELCPCLACCNCYAQHCALGSASDGFH